MYVADLKAKLGFRIEDKKLRQFEAMLRNTQKKLESSGKRLQNSINGVTREQVQGLNRVDTKLQHQKKQLDEINRKYVEQKALADRAHAAASRRALKGGSGTSAAAGGAAGGAAVGGAGGMIGMAAMVGTGGAFFSNEAFQARQGLIKAFTSIEGSVEAARSKFDEIVNEANEYGLSAQSLAESYKQIRNALEGTGIENASLKVTKALEIFGTATGMTSQETIRAIDAISDTAAQGSLDNINAEQLARSTGVNIVSMAKALDMSAQEFQKALSEGKITPDKFIEPFADLLLARANQGGALDRAKSSTQAQQNRAANQFLESNAVLNASGLNEYFNKVYQALREMLQTAEPLIEELGEFFSGAAESSSKNIKSFGNLLAAIGNVSDSLDGIDIESPFISLNELLTGLTNFINDVADTIDFLRSDDTWQEKLSGINDLLINTLKRITETFINMAIENVNRILPSFMEMDNVNFETRSLKRLNSDVIDMSGVNALMSEIARKVPRTPDVHDPAALPFGPVMNRQGEAFNTTNNNNQTFNFEIHGEDGNIQDQVIQVINDYVIRPASISEVQSEK